MLFNSYEFLFVFLPIVLIGFHLAHLKSRRAALDWITFSSLVFYGYWDYRYLGLIVPSVLFNWAMGRLIGLRRSRTWLMIGVTANLLVIAWFKYSLFLFMTVTGHSIPPPEFIRKVVLPLGISFFTFQQIAYLVNVYRGRERPASLETHAFIVLFFPHLIAGPIVLYENIVAQVRRDPRVAGYFSRSAKVGLFLLSIGLFKKVVVADSLAPYVNAIFAFAAKRDYELLMPDAVIGATAYSLQLYFDFSGYSDMALGLALLFGFRLPVNFNSPYKARSIIDFWRRWHMTLSSFFRVYVYIPMGGNRHGRVAQLAYVMIVFFLTGLWHGAGWIFVGWGILHGVLVAINHLWSRTVVARELGGSPRGLVRTAYSFASWALTMLAVVSLWVVFRADSWATVAEFARAIWRFQVQGTHPIPDMYVYYALFCAIPLLFAVCCFMPNSIQMTRWGRQKLRLWERTWGGLATRKAWFGPWLPAVVTGGFLYMATTSIRHVKTAFLYFNF